MRRVTNVYGPMLERAVNARKVVVASAAVLTVWRACLQVASAPSSFRTSMRAISPCMRFEFQGPA